MTPAFQAGAKALRVRVPSPAPKMSNDELEFLLTLLFFTIAYFVFSFGPLVAYYTEQARQDAKSNKKRQMGTHKIKHEIGGVSSDQRN